MPKTASIQRPGLTKNQSGQVFLEFILLLLLLVTLAFSFMSGFRSLVGGRWELMLKIIAKPNQDSVTLP